MTSTPSAWPVRALSDDDWEAFAALDSHAFAFTMPDEALAAEREMQRGMRQIGAYDGATLAGIASAYDYDLSVPGGSSPPPASAGWACSPRTGAGACSRR